MTEPTRSDDCGCGPAGCAPPLVSIDRRSFLRASSAAAAALAGRAFAGPFEPSSGAESLVPKDKKLDAAWVRSLFERGAPSLVRGDALEHVGMPVGGIGCGQLYLGGDGRLWLFDLFNQPALPGFSDSTGPHYAKPLKPSDPLSPIRQGFVLRVDSGGKSSTRTVTREGFSNVAFRGEYPIGRVTLNDPAVPIDVALTAYSPFVPLDVDRSSLPTTILEYTLTNTGPIPAVVTLAGYLTNGASRFTGVAGEGMHRNRVVRRDGFHELVLDATRALPAKDGVREDIVVDRFERTKWAPWTTTGTAFGDGPTAKAEMPKYQGDVGGEGERVVNTHNARNGEDVIGADRHVGTLTSPPFELKRDWLSFWIGGGKHAGTCVELWIGDERVAHASGRDDNRMSRVHFDVRPHAGKKATLRVVDSVSGPWGQIALDDVILTDRPAADGATLEAREDWGSMSLALLREVDDADLVSWPDFDPSGDVHAALAARGLGRGPVLEATRELGKDLVGALGVRVRLAPGESVTLPFVFSWHFSGLWRDQLLHIAGWRSLRREYANRFANASAVTRFVHENYGELADATATWNRTWYDSTLPYWLLDRTFANASTLATATCLRFDTGRFYANEGTYCCAGTCSHVWQYAQTVARVFPSLERSLREKVDFGIAFRAETGAIDYRGEAHQIVAIDGQCGCVLRTLREHQMSADSEFLGRVWPRVKRSIEYLLAQDVDQDGLLDGAQYNTLDTAWFGKNAWLSSLYVAALRAGERMASDVGDLRFAARCAQIAERGSRALVERLFDGEYFIHELDPAHPEANNTNKGCHIDQMLGQSWALQLGLPRIVPLEPSRSALRSLWNYNFAPDAGGYRNAMNAQGHVKGGRWYAMEGEGGLLMCSFPKGGAELATGKSNDAWAAGYFNECMSGFEHMAAAHMIFDGLIEEGLAVVRAIHDRYDAARRNPWNEVECSDHYARAMASHGVFLAVCGFELDGPRGHIGFAPRLSPDAFKAPFVGPSGFGTYAQQRDESGLRATLAPTRGDVRVRSFAVELAAKSKARAVTVLANDVATPARFEQSGQRVVMTFAHDVTITAGSVLELRVVTA